MTRYTLTVLLFVLAIRVSGQVVIQFVPEVSGRSVNGLFQCKIINSNRAQSATLTITVSERTQGTVCIVKTPSFNLVQGVNSVPLSASQGASVQFPNSNTGQLLNINRQFPEGDYTYCFDIKLSQSDLPEEQCFSYLLAPFSELSLIDPANNDKICDTKPLLSWQPLIPGIQGSYYQLVLAQIKSGQSPIEALNYNLPVINQSGIVSPVLVYPSIAPQLTKGSQYAWQVTVYKDQTILNRSEIWSFTVDCQDSLTTSYGGGYRSITDLQRGNNYIALGKLKFALVNPYMAQQLNYEIRPLSNTDKKIKRLPNIQLKAGDNQITIDLQDNGSFKDGQYYVLRVWVSNGAPQSLRFLYEEPQ